MWGDKGRCAVALGFDLDVETLWLSRGLTTPSPLSRGKYGAYVSMPRILNFLAKRNIPATFFIPGWVADLYRPLVKEIIEAGHEVAHHGWLHDDPNSMPIEQEREEFIRGVEVLRELGANPRGYRSPAFDLGPNTLNLLKEFDYLYDTSMMAHETPYYIVDNGENSGVIELPVCWELDDAPFYLFAFKPAYRQGLQDPDSVVKVWQAEFNYAYRESGFYLLTLHPQLTGRGYRLDALGRVLDYIEKHPQVWFATHEDIAKAYNEVVDPKNKLKIELAPGWHDPAF
ncbi:MAG: polysaccharide deacetylase [Deltaproteobacteria bacterium]|nr:polysaccharide deacetylase [Deltaproteobacteria bacterium]